MSDAAIANVVTGVVTVATMLIGFLTLWVKLRYGAERADEAATKAAVVEKKIDNNTLITRAGAVAAARTAEEAKGAVEAVAQTLDRKLNGGVDSAVAIAIAPLQKTLKEHSESIHSLSLKLDVLVLAHEEQQQQKQQPGAKSL